MARPQRAVRRRLHPRVMSQPTLDHLALTVPDLDEQVERLVSDFGMIARTRFEGFAVLVDPATDFKLELSVSDDDEVHVRHLGFRTDDVDAAHDVLLAAGMSSRVAPQRQDFAGMYTSYLEQPGGVEVQLVRYD